jgi:hypothetical protein
MMVSDFMEIGLPMDLVERRIRGADRLGILADAAYRRGEALAIGPSAGVTVPVEFSIGVPVVGSNSVAFPISWRASGATQLFPHMDAELVLSPLADGTHVEFRGVYTPPMGAVGALLDRVALHRLASATVRNFLERLVELIEVSGAAV